MNLTEEEIKSYLDTAIRNWRNKRDSAQYGDDRWIEAVDYIDAFQSVRVTLFGEALPPDKVN